MMAPTIFVISLIVFFVTVVIAVVLQLPWISRIWLNLLPAPLSSWLKPYYNDAPALYPGVPAPTLFEAEVGPAFGHRISATVLRAVHKGHGWEHYRERFMMTFIAVIIVVSMAAIMLTQFVRLFGYNV